MLNSDTFNFQDGASDFPSSPLFWGLSALQIAGVVIGVVALLSAIAAAMILLVKRLIPGCDNFRAQSQDTQILVIESNEDAESDPDIT